MDPKAASGRFIERYSTGGTNEILFLNLAAFVSCISTIFWEIFKLQNWRYLAIIALCFMWCGSLPFYLVLNRNQRPALDTFRDGAISANGAISVRLYITWLTGALIFGLFDMAQYVYGSIFDYNVYARVTTMMLVLAFVTFGRTRDSTVAYMAMWFLSQVVSREDSFEGDADAKETFEKLLEVAKIVWPVFAAMIFDCLNDIPEARAETTQYIRVVDSSSEEEHTFYGSV